MEFSQYLLILKKTFLIHLLLQRFRNHKEIAFILDKKKKKKKKKIALQNYVLHALIEIIVEIQG